MKRIVLFLALLFSLFLFSDCANILAPYQWRFRVAVHNRTADSLLVYFNGKVEYPVLEPGSAYQYRPKVVAERRGYGSNYYYYARIHVSAKDMETGKLSRTKTVYLREDETGSVTFSDWDFY